MILKDIELNGNWLDLYTELGVTKDKTLFIQNKSMAALHIWMSNTPPDTKFNGVYLKSGDYITLNASGVSMLVNGKGTVYAHVV